MFYFYYVIINYQMGIDINIAPINKKLIMPKRYERHFNSFIFPDNFSPSSHDFLNISMSDNIALATNKIKAMTKKRIRINLLRPSGAFFFINVSIATQMLIRVILVTNFALSTKKVLLF